MFHVTMENNGGGWVGVGGGGGGGGRSVGMFGQCIGLTTAIAVSSSENILLCLCLEVYCNLHVMGESCQDL